MKNLLRSVLILGLTLFVSAEARAAAGGYAGASGFTVLPPSDPGSFTTVIVAFPSTTTRHVGGYPLASRILAATGRTIFLQKDFGGSDWLPVAVLSQADPPMDPAFLTVTPDGEKIAVGCGLGKPLYSFPTSLLSVDKPPTLTGNPAVKKWDLAYYAGAFRDSRYLYLNVGGDVLGESYISAVDTNTAGSTPVPIIDDIPGASGGIAFDAAGDLVTGIGWDPAGTTTGDLKIFPAASITAPLAGPSIAYATHGLLLATGMLSADSLGFDGHGNVYVGGGDVFGTSGHFGYANVVSHDVVTRVLAGGAPADSTKADEVTEIAPDPCHNDDSTRVIYVPGVDMLLVTANLLTMPPTCDTVDYSTGPAVPATLYFPPGAPDSDHDGVPDGADHDFEVQLVYGRAELSKLVNALDAKKPQPTYDATVDYDGNTKIDNFDFAYLRAHWGLPLAD